ncbi:MAG: helix-turn-helix transcriptional regulator [Alphaproteobacteria bacterium]|nr:helix-turn-helix transcriptional regulator [Alphaproteobacteria bacterium]
MASQMKQAGNLEHSALEVAQVLDVLSNQRRLMIMCQLETNGDMGAGALATSVGLSQSALSQHLAKLRAEGLVSYSRDGQALRYRIADDRARALLAALTDIYCPVAP